MGIIIKNFDKEILNEMDFWIRKKLNPQLENYKLVQPSVSERSAYLLNDNGNLIKFKGQLEEENGSI